MNERFIRTESLIGAQNLDILTKSSVVVFGIGGVGGYVVEALARVGVGKIALVDCDTVSFSNINRQIIALSTTVGKDKVDVAKERIFAINPDCKVFAYNERYCENNQNFVDLSEFDFVVDAIDTVSSKILLIENSKKCQTPIISCMGTGNRTVADFEIDDISKSSGCPLAKVMRKELKDRGISDVKVLFSRSNPNKVYVNEEKGKRIPSSISYVPAIAGLMIAQYVVNVLIK